MSKRARGTNRPGQRRPTQRVGTRPPASPSATGPAAASASAPAAVAPDVSEAALASPALPSRTRARASSTFAASAAQEYAYVVSDVRRIILVGGSLVGVILVLFLLIDVLRVITI